MKHDLTSDELDDLLAVRRQSTGGGSMALRAWQPPQGYWWKVVHDPTRAGDEPGMFYGGHFRWADIIPPGTDRDTRSIPCPWPSGTVFENLKTGERVVIRHGRVLRENKPQWRR